MRLRLLDRFILVGLWLLACASGWGRDIRVPDDFPTISQAIDAAQPGQDRVVITNKGTFNESLAVKKDLVLVADPPGAIIAATQDSTLTLQDPATSLTLQGFTICSARQSGFLLDGSAEREAHLSLIDMTIAGNPGAGMAFRSGNDCQLLAERCRFENNGGGNIQLMDRCAILVGGWDLRSPDTAPARWGFMTQHCVGVFEDVQMEGGAGRGLVLEDPASKTWVRGDIQWLQDSNGQPIEPPVRRDGDAMMPKTHEQGGPKTFEDVSTGNGPTEASQSFLAIDGLFIASIGGDPGDVPRKALEFICSHPEDWRACALFQTMTGDLLSLNDPSTCQALASAVCGHPNSPLAGAVCGELVMEAMNWPSKNETIERFIQLCSPPGDSLAGTLLAATEAWTSGSGATPEVMMNALDQARERWPGAYGMAYPAYSHGIRLGEPGAMDVLCNRSQKLLELLDQAMAWLSIGKTAQADRLLKDAQRIRQRFFPAPGGAAFLPEAIEVRYGQVAQAVRGRQTAPHPQPEVLIALLEAWKPYPEFNMAVEPGRDLAIVMQWMLDDLEKRAREGADPGGFSTQLQAVRDLARRDFGREEGVEILTWMENHLGQVTDADPALGRAYHTILRDMAYEYNQPAAEKTHLEWISKHLPKTEESFDSRERLTQLYLGTWKEPDKAIEMQRENVADFSGTDRDYQARIRIAKILYEQKAYAEAAAELLDLLERIPEHYDTVAVHTLLGLTYMANNQMDEARNAFAKVINQDQGANREKCLYLMGYSYIVEQRYNEAIRPFNDLKSLYPDGAYSKKATDILSKLQTMEK